MDYKWALIMILIIIAFSHLPRYLHWHSKIAGIIPWNQFDESIIIIIIFYCGRVFREKCKYCNNYKGHYVWNA